MKLMVGKVQISECSGPEVGAWVEWALEIGIPVGIGYDRGVHVILDFTRNYEDWPAFLEEYERVT